jgi:hypothetical protein
MPLSRLLLVLGVLLPRAANAEVLDLSIRGSVSLRPTESVSYVGLVELTVGWEALFFGRGPGSAAAAWSETAGPDLAPAKPSDPTLAEEPAPPHASPAPTLDGAWLRPGFALELVRAVMSQGDAYDAVLSSLATRSRTGALLPELRLRAGRGTDQSLRYSPTTEDPDRWLVSGAADYNYEAQASWTFDRLIFADDEIAIERLRQQGARARGERGLKALKLLFVWQRAWVRLRVGNLEPEKAWAAELDALQAQAELDVLSGGWFSKQLALLGVDG